MRIIGLLALSVAGTSASVIPDAFSFLLNSTMPILSKRLEASLENMTLPSLGFQFNRKGASIAMVPNNRITGVVCDFPFNEVTAWLGIPYADAPVGQLRFRPPVPFSGSYPLIMDRRGPPCFQKGEGSEDCLYLDVYAPTMSHINSNLPVRIFFHGGDFKTGSSIQGYGCPQVATSPSIFVSVQYRLGPFGFLAHPDTMAESGTTGNWGLLDQQLAIKWVRNNIAAFGGNPENIMIWGQGAGASSVYTHYVMPSSIGLFKSAISESGTEYAWRTLQMAYSATAGLSSRLGCMGTPGSDISCLRLKTAGEILAAVQPIEAIDSYSGALDDFMPVVDGTVLPRQPLELYNEGLTANVPYLIGINVAEGRSFAMMTNFNQFVTRSFPPQYLQRIMYQYVPSPQAVASTERMAETVAAAFTDAFFRCPQQRTLRTLSRRGIPVFSYGARHLYELPYVLGVTGPAFIPNPPSWVCWMTELEKRISTLMMETWASMNALGRPIFTTTTAVNWMPWTEQNHFRVNFGPTDATDVLVGVDDYDAQCRLWNEVAEAVALWKSQ